MASVMNGSFASPLANADYVSASDGGLLSRAFNNISGLSVFVTFLLILVAYDQCELVLSQVEREPLITDLEHSHVHLEQGFDYWPSMEDALRRTFPIIGEPQDGRI